MTSSLTCSEIRERALIERYVAGKVTDTEAAELETHYLTCASCQNDVRLAAAIRSAPPAALRRPYLLAGGAALALAAGLGAIVLFGSSRSRAEVRALGAVAVAPIYLGLPVRGAASPGDSVFAAAMAEYTSQRYDAAARGLEAALRAGVDSAPAEFFLAATFLSSGRNAEAATGFERVLRLGPSPYQPEAHYYLAKALLRLGRLEAAAAALRQVGDDNPETSRAASSLLDSIARLPRR